MIKHNLKYYLQLLLITFCTFHNAQAATSTTEEDTADESDVRSVQIGVPASRYPYSYQDKDSSNIGVLIDRVAILCQQSRLKCNFISGNFHENLDRLHHFKIDAILLIDSVILPDVDQIKLTTPLCKHNPIFVKKVRLSLQKVITNEDLKNSIIGVTKDSLFHLYALDNYYSFASIRPYETLESGIFDIFSNRIDVLFTEETFYNARIGTTSLGHKHSRLWLKKLQSDAVELPGTLMALAMRNDDALLDKINSAINSQGVNSPCTDLLAVAVDIQNRNPGDDNATDKD